MDYVAMQSCISGRNAFFTGMCPLRTGGKPYGAIPVRLFNGE